MLCATIHATLYAPSAHPPAKASAALLPQPKVASAAARAVAQRPAPECGEGVWCGQVASEAAPERAGDGSPPSFGWWMCAGEPRCAAAAAGRLQGGREGVLDGAEPDLLDRRQG